MSLNIDVKTMKTGFWHMPKTFYAVLFVEFWERFAFYGLQAVAVLYFVQKFSMKESVAENLFASFSALLYAMLTIGGAIGDKVLGLRRVYFLGIIFLIAGYGLVSMSESLDMLYFGMGVILMGNVFFKTNANNYVGRCFESNDPRLDSAFTYFYMSINLGSFISMVVVPIISQATSYAVGLSLPSIGMFIALITYFGFRKSFKFSDNSVGKNANNLFVKMLIISLIAVAFAYLFGYLLRDLQLSKFILYGLAAIIIVVYLFIATRLNKNEAKGMYIALALMLAAVVFFILYMQMATSMTLFADHNVSLSFFGYIVPAGVTQSFNPFFIIFLSPILANLYLALTKHNINLGIPAKFVFGIFAAGIGFIVLGLGAKFFANSAAQVSVIWLFLGYGFYSLGEMLVSALGASMVAQLLPKRLGGFGQGMWFLGTAIGMKIGGQLSTLAADDSQGAVDSFHSLHLYTALFYKLGVATLIIALVFFFTIKPLTRAMQQVMQSKY